LYHVNVGSDVVMRHTPYADQRLYMLAQERYDMEAQVLADAYHDNYLNLADVETVNFWQSIKTPDTINVTPAYLVTASGATQGTIAKGNAVNKGGIFAVLTDRDACGITAVNEWADSIWNPRAGASYWYFHATWRYWNSFTENALVFTLD
jgi:phage gp46-like protein